MYATIPDGLDEIGLTDGEFKARHRVHRCEQALDQAVVQQVRVNRRRRLSEV